MNFYQKVYAFITLIVLAVTAGIFFIGFSAPYSGKFIIESIAVLNSELMLGILQIALCKKSDRIFHHSMGYSISLTLYFFFAVLMAFAVPSELELRIFALIHVVGLACILILFLLFYMAEHNFLHQETFDHALKQSTAEFQNLFMEVKIMADSLFCNDPKTLKTLAELADDIRYASDPSEKTMEKDLEIMTVLNEMKQSVKTADVEKLQKELPVLKRLIQYRESIK